MKRLFQAIGTFSISRVLFPPTTSVLFCPITHHHLWSSRALLCTQLNSYIISPCLHLQVKQLLQVHQRPPAEVTLYHPTSQLNCLTSLSQSQRKSSSPSHLESSSSPQRLYSQGLYYYKTQDIANLITRRRKRRPGQGAHVFYGVFSFSSTSLSLSFSSVCSRVNPNHRDHKTTRGLIL